jgi:hypothetical protein
MAQVTDQIVWDVVAAADSYVVQLCDVNSVPIREVPVTSADVVIADLLDGEGAGTYVVKVKSVNEVGESAWSAGLVLQIDGPAVPQNLRVA